MTSKEYWQKRETEHAKKNKMSEQAYAEEIRKTYAYMADQIQKEIDGFYTKYATKEGISLAEAKRRVSKLDIEEYGIATALGATGCMPVILRNAPRPAWLICRKHFAPSA